MSYKKKHFYKTLNNIVATKRIDNEEAYIINDYISWLESQLQQKENIIKEVREYVRSNEWAKDYEKSSCRTHILEILDKEIKE